KLTTTQAPLEMPTVFVAGDREVSSVEAAHGISRPLSARHHLSFLAFLLLLDGGMFSPSSPPTELLEKVFQYIDLHQDEFVQTLKEWVAVESDSVQPVLRLRRELLRMMGLAAERLRLLGARVDSVDAGFQQLPDGQSLPIPPIILAELGDDPKKPTVCFYGHLDVQPARQEDGKTVRPRNDRQQRPCFSVDQRCEHIQSTGRGSARERQICHRGDGGGWFSCPGGTCPEREGRVLLKRRLHRDFRQSVDQPEDARAHVKCRDQDFHSGTFGGILNEPMADLVALLGSLVDSSGRILIPGIYDHVAPVTEEEKRTYEAINLDLEEYRKSSQVKKFLFDTKEELLMHLWRYPSLSIHGIEGAFHEPGAKTVIPGRVIGKFSVRLVPHMNMSVVEKQVKQHLDHIFSKRNSSNQMTVSMTLGLHPWTANTRDNQYLAAKRAIKTVFGTEPDMIRDGSTIPIAKIFQDAIQKSALMLPLGAVDDGEHSQNEKIDRSVRPVGAQPSLHGPGWNYIEGSKLFAAFFLEMAKLH
ncbi:hypothetical protein E2I00_011213, partial [Balaenoptera physalus]